MAATKNNNQAIYIALAVAALGGIVYFVTKKKKQEVVNQEPAAEQPAAANPATTPTKPAATTPAVTLNKNLVLKNGSKGNEVKELQKLLGITADGIFGPQTEAALYNRKGVKQISLADFPKKPDVNHNALPAGTKVWGNVYPETTYYKANKNADGSFKLLSDKEGTVAGGEAMGKIITMTTDGTKYVLEDTNWWGTTVYGWVFANHVKKL